MATGITGTTRVMVKKLNNELDPPKMKFEINNEGRLHGLRCNYENGDYDLYIYYNQLNYRSNATYITEVIKMYYSFSQDKMFFDFFERLSATDTSYIRVSDGALVLSSEALDENGTLKAGYITEAVYFEAMLGGVIADQETIAIARKYSLPLPT